MNVSRIIHVAASRALDFLFSPRQRFCTMLAICEPLESRVLLSALTWVGGSGSWSDVQHWDDGTGGPGHIVNPTAAPNANDANVYFNDVGAVSVNMDVNPTVENLFIHGNSQVALNFNATDNAFTAHHDGGYHTGGVCNY